MMRFCIPVFMVFVIAKTEFVQVRYPGDAQLPILRGRNHPTYYTLNYLPTQVSYAYQPGYQPSYLYNYFSCVNDYDCPFGYGCYRNWFYKNNVCWPFHQTVLTTAAKTSRTTGTSTTTETASTTTAGTTSATTTTSTTLRTTEQTDESSTSTFDVSTSTGSNTDEPPAS